MIGGVRTSRAEMADSAGRGTAPEAGEMALAELMAAKVWAEVEKVEPREVGLISVEKARTAGVAARRARMAESWNCMLAMVECFLVIADARMSGVSREGKVRGLRVVCRHNLDGLGLRYMNQLHEPRASDYG